MKLKLINLEVKLVLLMLSISGSVNVFLLFLISS